MLSTILFYILYISSTVLSRAAEFNYAASLTDTIKEDTEQFIIVDKLGDFYYKKNSDSCLHYTQRAYFIATHQKGISADSLLYYQNKLLERLEFAAKSQVIIGLVDSILNKKTIDSSNYAHLLTFRANAYSALAQDNSALTDLIEAATIFSKLSNERYLADTYYSIGEVLRDQQHYEEALRYLMMASEQLNLIEASHNDKGRIQNSAAIILFENGRPDSAIGMLHALIANLNDEDSFIRSVLYNNMGLAQMHNNALDSSLYYLFKAKTIKEEQDNKRGLLYTNNSIADIYEKQQKYDLALIYLRENLQLLKVVDNLHQKRNTVKTMANILQVLEVWDSAFYYLNLHVILNDSILNEEKFQAKIKTIGTYDARLKEQENNLLKVDLALKKEQIISQKQKGAFTLAIIILALASIIVIAFFLRQKSSLLRKISEKNFNLRELNSEVNNLSAIIAHDLKSPLNRIEGLSTILSMEDDLSRSQTDILNKIRQVTTDGKSLISDLIDISYFEQNVQLNMMTIAVSQEIQNIIKQFEFRINKKELWVELVADDSLTIHSEPTYFKRITDNLLSNAIKFSSRGASIHITVVKNDAYVVLSVQDNGPGLTKADKSKLFKKFQKLSAQPTDGENSTGLGLSIVHTLCAKIKAPIEVVSEKGHGATFLVSFPNTK